VYYLIGHNVRYSCGQRVGTPAAARIGFPVGMPVERLHEGVKHTRGLQPDSPIEVVEEIPFMAGRFPICITSLARMGNATGIFIFWGRKLERELISA
jgi:hypothetical protein